FQMPIKTVDAGVQGAVLEPADIDIMRVEGGMLDLRRRLDPIDALGLFSPEPVGILDRLLVHGLILLTIDPGIGGDVVAYRVEFLLIGHWLASSRRCTLSVNVTGCLVVGCAGTKF